MRMACDGDQSAADLYNRLAYWQQWLFDATMSVVRLSGPREGMKYFSVKRQERSTLHVMDATILDEYCVDQHVFREGLLLVMNPPRVGQDRRPRCE